MTEPVITVLTVNYNTADFLELISYSLKRLTHNPYKLIICDNGSKSCDIKKLKALAETNKNIELIFRQQSLSASIAHGQGLDILIEKSDTKYTAVLDSDSVFLLKNWDIELISLFDEKVRIVGSTSPPVRAGNRLGGGDFPLPFSAIFETDTYKSLEISCMPGKIELGQDTCWQWKHKFVMAGFEGRTLNTKNTRDFKDGYFSDIKGVEEYYLPNGRLIASHFGRGASLGAAKYLKWLKIPMISTPMKKQLGKIDKRKWINKCFHIINSQA